MVLILAIIAIVFAAVEGARAWGPVVALIVSLVGILVALLVPFGVYGAIIGGIVLFQSARTARFKQIADAVDDDFDTELS